MNIYDKKAKTAIAFGIISFLYYLIAGVMIFVLIAFWVPTETLIYTLIIPLGFSAVGFSMAIYVKVKGGRKVLSISGIVLNLITLCIAVIFCILFVLTKTAFL